MEVFIPQERVSFRRLNRALIN